MTCGDFKIREHCEQLSAIKLENADKTDHVLQIQMVFVKTDSKENRKLDYI